ncbi:MAG: GGDEF domain-containing protein [Betaproteobacteria bacterium HGW-Betaproteobacteria-10]|nr:MAG: GGDEF domain-containing protein [Betaproteobacteria bacterium HGW-Betaproteobacteria-10]
MRPLQIALSLAPEYHQKIRKLPLIAAVLALLISVIGMLQMPGPWFATLLITALGGLAWLAWIEWRDFQSVRRAYDMAMLAAHDGFWEWNPLTKKLHVGTRLLEILGYQEDFLPDTNAWLKLVHPDDRAIYNKAVARHLKGESDYFYCEYRVLAKDGAYRWIGSRGLAVRDRTGKAYQMVGSVTDITERRNHQEELEFLAQHDALTGLPNRLRFSQHLSEALQAARENTRQLAVLFIDLDRFKIINDTLGHRAGDQLLQMVTQRLKKTMPAGCTLYRQGGDEFIVLMVKPENAKAATDLAMRLKEAVIAPFSGGESDFFTSASIGISLFPADADDGETLLRHADTAMYAAKAVGGNTIRSHTPLMNQRLTARMSLETRLRRAIQDKQLELHFQPQTDALSGRLVGAEALLRWHDGEKQIPPDHFIPVAEECGLIVPIGDWVIEQAIRQILDWRKDFGEIPPIAINLSPRQFWRPALSRLILEKLHAAGLPSHALEIEVTESVLLDPDGSSVEELLKLRAAGIQIALDDFGTGYSSLSYLQRLPISTLKIDRSFINELVLDDGSAGSEPMVKAILAMAKSLSFRVVAEGVESTAQLQHLQTLGCDVIQGYLISRPLPATEFAAKFLVDRRASHYVDSCGDQKQA